MRFGAYPEYSDSGVAYLGSIPANWRTKKLKHIAKYWVSNVNKVAEDNEIPIRLCNYTDVYYNEFIDETRPFMETTATCEEIARFSLKEGDVVITKDSESWDDIAVPALVKKVNGLVCGYHLAFIRSNQKHLVGQFLFRYLQSPQINQHFQVAATGVTRFGLPKEEIGSVAIALPSIPEQHKICGFIEHKTAQIDTLIHKKEELIEKLQEKRSALISRIVTQGLPPDAAKAAGLNPHPKMKDSGIEWLGKIPEHWELMQLKWAIMFQRGHDLPSDSREEGAVPVVSSSGISAWHNVAKAKGPGIVTGRYGTIGEFHLIDGDYWPLNTTLYSIALHGNSPGFLRYLLTNLSPLFLLNSVKSAVPGVDRNDIHSVSVAVPPVAEQRAILDYLDREGVRIDRMIEKVQAAIEKLTEYRSALITDAVTGNIDVRNYTGELAHARSAH